jgi:hypothetical protein
LDALDLSLLAFNFQVEKAINQSSWRARITIYNPNSTIVEGLQKQYTNVRLEAGYMPPSQQYGVIFAGAIAYYRYGRINATDTFVELHAATADEANRGFVNTTLPAGSRPLDVVNAVLAALGPYGIAGGYITDLGDDKSPRGRVVYGMCRDVLRDVARTAGATYHIDDDNKLHILKESEAFPSENVPVLNSKSGMIDVPAQTNDGGIEVHSLLNFAIRPNTRIYLNEAEIVRNRASESGALSNLPQSATDIQMQSMAISKSGLYDVGKVEHHGENRGNSWFTYITTKPVTPSGVNAPSLVKSA